MNIFEKQAKLQQELGELGADTWRQLSELANDSNTRYMQMNQSFADRFPNFGDIAGWTDFQREYGEAAWNAFQDYMKSQGDIVNGALEKTNQLYREAFTPEEPQAEAPHEAAA